MIKDSIRDYTTAAFRLYAALGQPETDEILKICPARKTNKDYSAALMIDLLAVRQTLDKFNSSGKTHIVKAVEEIYFIEPRRKIRRNEITSRVTRFARLNNTDESSVWRYLKEARTVCAECRGLNIDIDKIQNFNESCE